MIDYALLLLIAALTVQLFIFYRKINATERANSLISETHKKWGAEFLLIMTVIQLFIAASLGVAIIVRVDPVLPIPVFSIGIFLYTIANWVTFMAIKNIRFQL
jgi:hypothetical protein